MGERRQGLAEQEKGEGDRESKERRSSWACQSQTRGKRDTDEKGIRTKYAASERPTLGGRDAVGATPSVH